MEGILASFVHSREEHAAGVSCVPGIVLGTRGVGNMDSESVCPGGGVHAGAQRTAGESWDGEGGLGQEPRGSGGTG